VSILLAVGITAIIMVIGAAVDGGGRLREAQRAQDIAAEAARAGGQEINTGQAIAGGSKVLDPDAAIAAAQGYLHSAGVVGTAVVVDTTHIKVTVTIPYHTVLLGFMGIDTLTVSATATAAAVTT
jgi:Flp pilus assembly protein TadG